MYAAARPGPSTPAIADSARCFLQITRKSSRCREPRPLRRQTTWRTVSSTTRTPRPRTLRRTTRRLLLSSRASAAKCPSLRVRLATSRRRLRSKPSLPSGQRRRRRCKRRRTTSVRDAATRILVELQLRPRRLPHTSLGAPVTDYEEDEPLTVAPIAVAAPAPAAPPETTQTKEEYECTRRRHSNSCAAPTPASPPASRIPGRSRGRL